MPPYFWTRRRDPRCCGSAAAQQRDALQIGEGVDALKARSPGSRRIGLARCESSEQRMEVGERMVIGELLQSEAAAVVGETAGWLSFARSSLMAGRMSATRRTVTRCSCSRSRGR